MNDFNCTNLLITSSLIIRLVKLKFDVIKSTIVIRLYFIDDLKLIIGSFNNLFWHSIMHKKRFHFVSDDARGE